MAERLIQETTLTGIADAIRSKTGETGKIAVSDMATKIQNIVVDNTDSGDTMTMATGQVTPSYRSQSLTLSSVPFNPKVFMMSYNNVTTTPIALQTNSYGTTPFGSNDLVMYISTGNTSTTEQYQITIGSGGAQIFSKPISMTYDADAQTLSLRNADGYFGNISYTWIAFG